MFEVIVSIVILIVALGALALVRKALVICPPNRVLIISGRSHALADGTTRGYRTLFGGRGFVIPILDQVAEMSLSELELPISMRNVYSKGGIPLNVDAIANVKISSDPRTIGNAIERFLGRGVDEIARVARETLEGHLRGVVANLTPEEVNEDRLKFVDKLADESEADLSKLGIHLDTLQITHVSDEVAYLDSIGRSAIAQVVRDAEIAESDAKREAEQIEAQNMARANVMNSNVEAQIAKMNNELRRVQAELVSRVRSEEERTAAAAREARAKAEQELQEVRAQLAGLRLQVDQVIPAEAARAQEELRAQGAAAAIRENGRAVALAIDALHKAWADAGDSALRIYLIKDLDKILSQVAKTVRQVKIENLSMIDSGDGQTLSSYVAAYPAMLSAVFKSIADTTGIDIPGEVAGRNGEAPNKPAVG
ncbi:MAG: SPFH domain-containing protein [Myxococcota bacterium]